MERQRSDFVVIFAGYKDEMETFYQSNPGLKSRVSHHIDFPDYSNEELMQIATMLLQQQNYCFDDSAVGAFADYIARRRQLPLFANARSIRNAIDRMRLRQANRLFARMGQALHRDDLITITAADILSSRVFLGEVEGQDPALPLT